MMPQGHPTSPQHAVIRHPHLAALSLYHMAYALKSTVPLT
jgi:hypothetical protein